ncbi:MAG: tagaturonate reductase [Oscillospiraceae bacterium]|nr:tagaturonate reductase [Oscillospiraceae bacterium]
MKKLNLKVVSAAAEAAANLKKRPERILQFGEGVFLRAFADYFIDRLNASGLFNGSIIIVPPTPRGSAEPLNNQDCLYTVLSRGLDADGDPVGERRIITSVSRAINAYTDFDAYIACARSPDLQVVISNTTEAGIVFDADAKRSDRPQLGFPAKIAAFLHERYSHFAGDPSRGLAFLPCELIERNGVALRECVMRHADAWRLGDDFKRWVDASCVFADTLVDRIVMGYPADEADALAAELGYDDALLDAGELYHFWAIRAGSGAADIKAESANEDVAAGDTATGGSAARGTDTGGIATGGIATGDTAAIDLPSLLPFHKAGLNVVYTDDIEMYTLRKIRLLNGAHTALASCALLSGGCEYVREAVQRPLFDDYLRAILFDEIPATLTPQFDSGELSKYAQTILNRFENPYINHKLSAIMLNATSKYKVRLLPSILEYYRRKVAPPPALTFSMAALISYYRVNRDRVADDAQTLEFFTLLWEPFSFANSAKYASTFSLAECALENTELWGENLNRLPGFTEAVDGHLQNIILHGVDAALESMLKPS